MASRERRLKLSKMLHEVLGSDEVHYDPPESVKMSYPAIIYNRDNIDTVKADDATYLHHDKFIVTLIRNDADTDLVDKMLDLPYCGHDRTYTTDDLYHDVFTIFI